MAQWLADNFTQIPYMGAYGNAAIGHGEISLSTGVVAADTLDLVKIPGGARVISGIVITATAITTATVAIGVRYADGTSTGGTTGTSVMSGTGVGLTTALAPQQLNFQAFVNDADTIVYATFVNGGAPGASTKLTIDVLYSAEGTK